MPEITQSKATALAHRHRVARLVAPYISTLARELEQHVTSTHACIRARQRIEVYIAHALLVKLFNHASQVYSVRVYNGEEFEARTQSVEATLKAMFASDEDRVYVDKLAGVIGSKKAWHNVGWIYFVYGNDGWDVISDHTDNYSINELVAATEPLATYFGGRG